MYMTHQISSAQAKSITAEIKKAVEGILAEHGLAADRVSSKYGSLYEFKIQATREVAGKNGVNLSSVEAQAWVQYASWRYGFEDPADALGAVVNVQGRDMIFNGYNPRARKMPIMLTDAATGKQYKYTEKGFVEKLPGYKEKTTSGLTQVGVPYVP